MASGRLRGPWVQELKSCSPADCPGVVCGNVEAGGRSPGRVPWVTPLGLSVACLIHARMFLLRLRLQRVEYVFGKKQKVPLF